MSMHECLAGQRNELGSYGHGKDRFDPVLAYAEFHHGQMVSWSPVDLGNPFLFIIEVLRRLIV